MKRYELVVTLVVSLILGGGLFIAMGGLSAFTRGRSSPPVVAEPTRTSGEQEGEPLLSTPIGEGTTGVVLPTREGDVSELSPSPSPVNSSEVTPTAPPILNALEVGSERGEDLGDVLLLYDPARASSFDTNFCKIADYYGLACERAALDSTELTDHLLRDGRGDYFKLVGITAETLLEGDSNLSGDEMGILKEAIQTGGVNLLVSGVDEDLEATALTELTDGGVLGFARPQDLSIDWTVSAEVPAFTREFTGQVITATHALQGDHALVLSPQDAAVELVTSTDEVGAAYPVFVMLSSGDGAIFVDAGADAGSLDEQSLGDLYFLRQNFSKIVPLMMTMRYALEDEVWHNDRNYANLTIDHPPLWQPQDMPENMRPMNYSALLPEMEEHDFHTTIGVGPTRFLSQSDPVIVRLFQANPGHFSLAPYGNRDDGFEFYEYEVSDEDEYPARPYADQVADISEALESMDVHEELTGIPIARAMIPPWGNMPQATLGVLKENNFLASVQSAWHPFGATRSTRWDYGMRPANLDYANFPLLWRYLYSEPEQFDPWYVLGRLFVDKPVLLASTPGLFRSGIDAFNPTAQYVNSLEADIEWRGLGDILTRLHLQKLNDDGSVDVRMYTNHLMIENDSDEERTYHVTKEEALNVPISTLTVNGREFPYVVEDGLLSLDVSIPAHQFMEIIIQYGD